jgi:hypothetical protein
VQSGTPLFALQAMERWETEKMVRRYARLAVEDLARDAAVHVGIKDAFLAKWLESRDQ